MTSMDKSLKYQGVRNEKISGFRAANGKNGINSLFSVHLKSSLAFNSFRAKALLITVIMINGISAPILARVQPTPPLLSSVSSTSSPLQKQMLTTSLPSPSPPTPMPGPPPPPLTSGFVEPLPPIPGPPPPPPSSGPVGPPPPPPTSGPVGPPPPPPTSGSVGPPPPAPTWGPVGPPPPPPPTGPIGPPPPPPTSGPVGPPPRPIGPPYFPNCSSNLSCKGRCQQTMDFSLVKVTKFTCFCDPFCELFEDCCADFDLHCSKGNPALLNSSQQIGNWNCYAKIWMIDICPKTWSPDVVSNKCRANKFGEVLTYENYKDLIPVAVIKRGATYRNRYCAQCHGVEKEDMEYYQLDFTCDISPPRSLSREEALEFLFKYCSIFPFMPRWNPKRGQPFRKCWKPDTCYYTRSPSWSQCTKMPPRLVFHRKIKANFKNSHCALCFWPTSVRNIECGPVVVYPPQPPAPPIPFSIIMDTNKNQSPKKTPYEVKKIFCKNYDEVYDPYLDFCRPIVSQLVPKAVSRHFDNYRIATWITISSSSKTALSELNETSTLTVFSEPFGINSTNIQIQKWESIFGKKVEILILDFQIPLTGKINRGPRVHDLSFSSLINFTRPILLRWKNEYFTIIKATAKRISCIDIKHYTPQEYTILPNSSVFINSSGKVLTSKDYYANQTTILNDDIVPAGEIAVCIKPFIHCVNGSYITLQRNEYTMLPNQSVYRNVSDSIYNQDEYYEKSNESVVVCSHFSHQYTKFEGRKTQRTVHDKVLEILTYVGLSLSVICLAATLITYTLFAELRTIPGINLMNLSSALLAAHLFWLIGSGLVASHRACVAMAVILHFLFLASFMWMSIIAYSTWKVFSASGGPIGASNDKEYRRKRIRRTLAIGWLPVVVFVAICVSLDLSKTVSIQYGGSKGCWINNGTANLCVFVIPVVIAMLWNTVFFGLTVKSIHKVRQQASMATEQRENQNYSVYIKIAVLMGFTWIFGVFGSFVSVYFMYPFVVLCTLQGVHIAFSFTFTRRVRELYKGKFIPQRAMAYMTSSLASVGRGRQNTFDTKL